MTDKPTVRDIIVVEGKYDRIAVLSAVNADVVEVSGFSVFNDRDKVKLLRCLAEKRPVVIMTDSDGAGFLIRGYLKGVLGSVKQAYIPDIHGRERRKREWSKERKLGVEGMSREVIIESLRRAGADFEDMEKTARIGETITKTDMYILGLSGTANSSERRRELLLRLDLPEHLTSNALLDTLNVLYTRDEFYALFK